MNIAIMKDEVWERAESVPGKSPAVYRQDKYGNVIRYDQYGEDTPEGWEINHRTPKDGGGTDEITNLRAMQTARHREAVERREKWIRDRRDRTEAHRARLAARGGRSQ